MSARQLLFSPVLQVEVTSVHGSLSSLSPQIQHSGPLATRGLRARTGRKPIGGHGLPHSQSEPLRKACSSHLPPLSFPPPAFSSSLSPPDPMACFPLPHTMTPIRSPMCSPPQCPQSVALSTWGAPACRPSKTHPLAACPQRALYAGLPAYLHLTSPHCPLTSSFLRAHGLLRASGCVIILRYSLQGMTSCVLSLANQGHAPCPFPP